MSSRSACGSVPSPRARVQTRRGARRGAAAGLAVLLMAGASGIPGRAAAAAAAADDVDATPEAGPIVLAQDGGTTPRELEPRYPAPDPGKPGPYNEQEREIWNGDYVFGMSRSLARSTIVPAAKAPLFLFTVPLDVVFLPFALIGGFFG
ncbi:MAG: hypothetical protein U0900_22835 [Myxococcota bacterium]